MLHQLMSRYANVWNCLKLWIVDITYQWYVMLAGLGGTVSAAPDLNEYKAF